MLTRSTKIRDLFFKSHPYASGQIGKKLCEPVRRLGVKSTVLQGEGLFIAIALNNRSHAPEQFDVLGYFHTLLLPFENILNDLM
jgi:hypothetical protein